MKKYKVKFTYIKTPNCVFTWTHYWYCFIGEEPNKVLTDRLKGTGYTFEVLQQVPLK